MTSTQTAKTKEKPLKYYIISLGLFLSELIKKKIAIDQQEHEDQTL